MALSSLRLLLVEDHDDTSRALAILLRNQGHRVSVANCAARALELASQEPFDVVLSDIGLPDATGYDLMRELRSTQSHGLKGIALTGHGLDEDLEKSRAAGFSTHVVKPINFAHLAAVLKRVAEEPAPTA